MKLLSRFKKDEELDRDTVVLNEDDIFEQELNDLFKGLNKKSKWKTFKCWFSSQLYGIDLSKITTVIFAMMSAITFLILDIFLLVIMIKM